nr:hypothetical protein [uncultured Allomuricauda sp.]
MMLYYRMMEHSSPLKGTTKLLSYGLQIQIPDKEETALWDFVYATSEHRVHHDIERMTNGNICDCMGKNVPKRQPYHMVPTMIWTFIWSRSLK